MESASKDKFETLFRDLPDAEGAKRFVEKLRAEHPESAETLEETEGLFSDAITIAAYSPLLARTLLRNPGYLSWLGNVRHTTHVHSKDEVLESLARFALTNSTLETGLMLSRFRRRELIRIYLKDIRGLGTIAEITEDISNLADAIIEYALSLSIQEMDNRFGSPMFADTNARRIRAAFCVVALGKLGSKELNYSSDIDLLFVYSDEGETSGLGSKGQTSNREYFVKVSEYLTKLIGSDSGEGAPYRVDMRLRPHGRVGTLAISLVDAVKYYKKESRLWEKQVLIRSRCSAGNEELFERFFGEVEETVFSTELTPREALESVRKSKLQIDSKHGGKAGQDVKLDRGGIREIEFIAQAIQLAYGGEDRWIRSPHTLIAIARAADRRYIDDTELTSLSNAYSFLRKLEHRLQMENGLQTHTVPEQIEKRVVIAQRMGLMFVADFDESVSGHTKRVREIFDRIFGSQSPLPHEKKPDEIEFDRRKHEDRTVEKIVTSVKKSEAETSPAQVPGLRRFSRKAPFFARLLASNPKLVEKMPAPNESFSEIDLTTRMKDKTLSEERFSKQLSVMRKVWAEEISRIAAFEVYGKIGFMESLRLQTELAQASIETALRVTCDKCLQKGTNGGLHLAVLGLGKLGAGGMDYGSDLDLVLVHDEEKPSPSVDESHAQFYSHAAEIFTRTISGMTRQGSLYKVDLRLRPDGRNGSITIGNQSFLKYLRERAAVWEWLAYVKLRGVSGPPVLLADVEVQARETVHMSASLFDAEALKHESFEMRGKLEQIKTDRKRVGEIDIKYGEGGLQDVYFAIRYLQLRNDVRDDSGNRGTLDSLQKLRDADAIGLEDVMSLKLGYKFLRRLDHYLRLHSGRSSLLRTGDRRLLDLLSESMNLADSNELLNELTGHRMQIHSAFRSVFELTEGI